MSRIGIRVEMSEIRVEGRIGILKLY